MTEPNNDATEPLDAGAAELEAAAASSDQQRARVLEELYETLENELERDVGQTGPSRH